MLERASTCLESGGRQLLRAPQQCLPSRRSLNHSFWHSAAGDLGVPLARAAAAIFDPARGGDVDDWSVRAASPRPRRVGPPLLDFLYPHKTLALLKQLSGAAPNVSPHRRRQLRAGAIRCFTSVHAQPRHDEPSVDAAVAAQAKREADALLERLPPTEALDEVLRIGEPGKQEVAWQLYYAIPADALGDSAHVLRVNLLEYLSRDVDNVVPGRVLQLFSEVPVEHRQASSFRAAVVAYLDLRMVGPAIQLLEDAPFTGYSDMLRAGTDLLLRRTVLDEQWDLSLRVFRVFLRHVPTLHGNPSPLDIRYGNTLPGLWRETSQLPGLLGNLQSFFNHVREYQHELTSSEERKTTLSCFSMTFIPLVMNIVLDFPSPSEKFIRRWFRQLFQDLQTLNLPTSACYEHAIKRMLKLPRYQQYTERPWLNLYHSYKARYLDDFNSAVEARPSQQVVRRLISECCHHDDTRLVHELLQDLRSFYVQAFTPGLLRLLIQTFANRGDHVSVHKYFQQLQNLDKEQIDLGTVSSLLVVYARRADVEATKTQFHRIRNEFMMVPDTACWNILLLAHVRADDIDGALECFNTSIENGIAPDMYTFGPLLDFCASRGDVDTFEALFARAKEFGLPIDSDVRARSSYVQLFLNTGDVKNAEAIAQEMLKNWKAGALRGHPLTHTWNLLIQHHALNGDIAKSRALYREMTENKIPLDSWTYGSLMRALVEIKQTNTAFKLLNSRILQQQFRAHALHYAIAITGFMKEGQLDLASRAFEAMQDRDVRYTESSRQASMLIVGTRDLARLKMRKAKHPNYRLLNVEKILDDMLIPPGAAQDIAHREPRHVRNMDLRSFGTVPQAYYGLLISLYSKRGAYAICKKLFKQAEKCAPGTDNFNTSLTLLAAIMEAHLKAEKYEEVAKCWELARTTADRLTNTFYQATHPRPAMVDFDSLLDPSVLKRFEQAPVSSHRRHILFQASRIYIRSLLRQPGQEVLQTAQRTIRDLLVSGFTVDNLTWNEFIQELALRDNVVDAFAICEEYLMPQFPGWYSLNPNYIRKDVQGYKWMDIRSFELKKQRNIPRYKTLVILAKSFSKIKQDESVGIGYDHSAGAWDREMLEQGSPMTVRAIESMPATYDRIQRAYFDEP